MCRRRHRLSGVTLPDGEPNAAGGTDAGALLELLFLWRPDLGICQEQVKLLNATAISDAEIYTNIHICGQE